MFTKQHHKIIADIIKHSDASFYHDGCMGSSEILFTSILIKKLSVFFENDNPLFNKNIFTKMCSKSH